MTVYVDDLKHYSGRGRMSGEWCHMVADTDAELNEMAEKIGLSRLWYQPPSKHRTFGHYDLRPNKRLAAIRNGAIAVPMLALMRYMNTGKWEAPTNSNRKRWELIDALGARDGWLCCLCGRPLNALLPAKHPWSVTLEHVIPVSQQGLSTMDNLRLSHQLCNNKRGVKPIPL